MILVLLISAILSLQPALKCVCVCMYVSMYVCIYIYIVYYEGWNFNFGNTPLDWIQELLE